MTTASRTGEGSSFSHTRTQLSLSAPTTPTFLPTAEFSSAPEARPFRSRARSGILPSGVPRRSRVRQFRPQQEEPTITSPRMPNERVVITPNPRSVAQQTAPNIEIFGLRNDKFKIRGKLEAGQREGKEIKLSERPIRVLEDIRTVPDSGGLFTFGNLDGNSVHIDSQPEALGQENLPQSESFRNIQPLLEISNNGVSAQESLVTSTENSVFRRPLLRNPSNVLRTRNSNRLRKVGQSLGENRLSQVESVQNALDDNTPNIAAAINSSPVDFPKILPNQPLIETPPSVTSQEQARSLLLSKGRQRWLVQTTEQASNDGIVESSRQANIPSFQVTKRRIQNFRRKEGRTSVGHALRNQAEEKRHLSNGVIQRESIPAQPLPPPKVSSEAASQDRIESKLTNQGEPIRLRPTQPIFLDPTEYSRLRQQVSDAQPTAEIESQSQLINPHYFSSSSSHANPSSENLGSSIKSSGPFLENAQYSLRNTNSVTEVPTTSAAPSFLKSSHFPSLYSNSVFGPADSSSSIPSQGNDLVSRTSSGTQVEQSTTSSTNGHAFSHGFDESKFVNFPRSFDPTPKDSVARTSPSNVRPRFDSFSPVSKDTSPRTPAPFTGTSSGITNSYDKRANSSSNTPRFPSVYSMNPPSGKKSDYSRLSVNTQFQNPISNTYSVAQNIPISFQTNQFSQLPQVNTQFKNPVSTLNIPSPGAQNFPPVSAQNFPAPISLPAGQSTPQSSPTQFKRISFPFAPSQSLHFPSRLSSARGSDVITASDIYYPVYGTLYMTDKNRPDVTSRIDFIQTVPSGSYSQFNL